MIDPVSLPNSAALNYGEGDVRHFSEGDAMDVPGLSRPTRNLAERDNILAEALNSVISVVNNTEQFVPLLPFRTTVPPDTEEIVLNYRIPAGFEARILNAIVTSVPNSSSAELDVYYATGYGNSTGTMVVCTSTEFTAGTQFYSAGEFIISLKNRGGTTLEMIASIQSTMRPLTQTSGVLIASSVVGEQGPPGPTGSPGQVGPPGTTGPAGSPGLTWQGPWQIGNTYGATDVVYWLGSSWKSTGGNNLGNQPDISPSSWQPLALQGTPGLNWRSTWNPYQTYNVDDGVQYLGNSYICISPSINQPPSSNPVYWDLMAQGGTGFRFRGVWAYPPTDGLGAYQQNDVVNTSVSGITQTYIAVSNPPNPTTSPPNSDWNLMFSAGTPAFSLNNAISPLYAEASYQAAGPIGQFGTLGIASYPGTTTYNLQEVVAQDASSGHGVGFIQASMYARWIGDVTLVLPGPAQGTQLTWAGTNVMLSIQSSGSLVCSGSVPGMTAYGTVNTQPVSGGVVAGFPISGIFAGQTIMVTGNTLSTNTTGAAGTNITIHSPTTSANSVYIGLMGMQVF
jgi:hypothetical protein